MYSKVAGDPSGEIETQSWRSCACERQKYAETGKDIEEATGCLGVGVSQKFHFSYRSSPFLEKVAREERYRQSE